MLNFYCKKKELDPNMTSLSKMVSSETIRVDKIFLCSIDIHGADVYIACRIIMIYFGRFLLQMTYNFRNSEIDFSFNSMRQQNESMLPVRKYFVTRYMITKRISKKPYKL